jgi:chemotaxis protein histidine kinase CheA
MSTRAVMQASLDELARMRDLVSAGQMPNKATSACRADPRVELMGRVGARRSRGSARCASRGSARCAAACASLPVAEKHRWKCRPRRRCLLPKRLPLFPKRQPTAAAAPAEPPSVLDTPVEPVAAAPSVAAVPLEEPENPAGRRRCGGRFRKSAPRRCCLAARCCPPNARRWRASTPTLLDTMLNNAGEVSIFRSRLDQQVNSIDFNLAELARTVTRLKDQLRGLEIETEAQVMNRHQDDGAAAR